MTFTGMLREILTIPTYTETECCTKIVANYPNIILNDGNSNLLDIEQTI